MSVFFFVSIRANRSKHDDFDNPHWILQLFKGGCISFVAKHRRALAFAIRDRISPGNEDKNFALTLIPITIVTRI